LAISNSKILGIPRGWVAVSCGALFYCYQFALRVSPNVMHNELMHDFAINATAFGTMIAFYSWSYAGVQIPLGIALDRLGPGILLTWASLICALSCFIFSISTSAYVASFALFLMGLGSAGGFLGSIKLGTVWFPPSHLARVIALIMVFGTLGAGIGGTPLSILTDALGWQATMQVLGGVGITTGNHAWDQKEIISYIDQEKRLIRPINYPKGTPGQGFVITTTKKGQQALIINAMARLFMDPLDDPFAAVDAVLAKYPLGGAVKATLIDFHGEATSEKMAM